jgi:hypothetical protein
MNRLLSGIMATTLAVSFAAASIIPAGAAPVLLQTGPAAIQGMPNIEKVQFNSRERWRRSYDRRLDRQLDRIERRQARRAAGDFYRQGDYYYYNGYRGFRERRRGYREYNGIWFPAAAFVAGALITGAITADRARSSNAHEEWCYDRYRSYRAYDNTFQPYNGPRRQCYSPYD